MKTSTPYFKNRHEIWIYSVLIIFTTLAALLAVKNIKISPDSMVYALISQEILSGDGIRLPIIKFEENYVPIMYQRCNLNKFCGSSLDTNVFPGITGD